MGKKNLLTRLKEGLTRLFASDCMTSARNYFWYGTIVTLAGVTLVFLFPRKKGPSSPPPAPTATICERPSKMERDIPINEIRGESEETDAILELSAKMEGTSRTDENLLESEETASPDEIRKLNSESEGESRIIETSEETEDPDSFPEVSLETLQEDLSIINFSIRDTDYRLFIKKKKIRVLKKSLEKLQKESAGEDRINEMQANLSNAISEKEELEKSYYALCQEGYLKRVMVDLMDEGKDQMDLAIQNTPLQISEVSLSQRALRSQYRTPSGSGNLLPGPASTTTAGEGSSSPGTSDAGRDP